MEEGLYIEGYIPLKEYSKLMRKEGYAFIEMLSNDCIFTPMLEDDDVKLLVDHNDNYKLDSLSNNLKIEIKDRKLLFSSVIEDKDIIYKVINNKIKGISFRFICYKQNELKINKRLRIRYLESIRLKEISLLTSKRAAYNGKITLYKFIKNNTLL